MVECVHCGKEFKSQKRLNSHLVKYGYIVKNPKHKALKELARQLLKDMGYADSEIREEYPIVLRGLKEEDDKWCDGQPPGKLLRVDIVGINSKKKIAIECGQTPAEKLVWLKPFFDEVIVLPHLKIFATEEETASYQLRRLRETLQKKERQYTETIDGLTEQLSLLRDQKTKLKETLILLLLDLDIINDYELDYDFRCKVRRWQEEKRGAKTDAEI